MAARRTGARAPAATTAPSPPELFETFARSYQEECAVLARSVMADRVGLEGRLAAVERKIAAMIRAIEDGLYQPAMKERMAALEAEKRRLVTELALKPDAAPIALHPHLPLLYRRKVEELEAVLVDPELGPEAMGAIRAMITRIMLTPGTEGGMEAVLEGDLARILTICEGAERKNARRVKGGRSAAVPVSQVSLVAGAGFEPATFRLGVVPTDLRASARIFSFHIFFNDLLDFIGRGDTLLCAGSRRGCRPLVSTVLPRPRRRAYLEAGRDRTPCPSSPSASSTPPRS